ncbi:MAG: cupin domain-containing protein [Acidobacteriota bacterium]
MTISSNSEGLPGLDELLAPITREEFFDRYWEKDFFHLERDDPEFYREIFSLDDVDRWIAAAPAEGRERLIVRTSDSQVVRRSAPGKFNPAVICADVAEGNTLILQAVQESWPPLQTVAAKLDQALSAETKVNSYLSPPGSKGFDRHIDYHDFFIFQVYGSKHWYLFETPYLPMAGLEYGPFKAFKEGTARGTEPLAEVYLKQGDMLYVPRGMPHYAAAIEETSLHLTVSFHPLYWTDFVKAAVESVAVEHLPMQRSLPPGFLNRPEIRSEMEAIFAECLAKVSEASFDSALRGASRSLNRDLRTEVGGQFTQVARLGDLSDDDSLNHTTGGDYIVEENGAKATIRQGASRVQGPAVLVPVFEFVRANSSFRVGDLPGLSDTGRLALARRLVRSGLLQIHTG